MWRGGMGGPATGRPEGGVPAAPNMPPKAALAASRCQAPWSDVCLNPSGAGVTGPGSTLIYAPAIGASCLRPTALAAQSHSPTHTLTWAAHPAARGDRGLQVRAAPSAWGWRLSGHSTGGAASKTQSDQDRNRGKR